MLWCSPSANNRRNTVNLVRNLQLICWTENDFFLSDTVKMNS